MALFSTAYWAPVSYYQWAAQSDCVQIEQHERYQKQSYRNRCTILSANGPLSLVVPVLRPHNCGIRDIRIDYSKPWRQIHWRAIEAAYRSAAFFEEYSADIRKVYQKEVPFLFDLNIQLWTLSQELLGVSFPWSVTDAFIPPSAHVNDYRFVIHPKEKRKPEGLALQSYFQVFGNKFGFVPDLSILDLIFNKGTL
jgi:hypothetical protein